jgi:hypothetical protein
MNPNAVIDRIAESRRAAPNGREGPIVDIDGCPTGVAALPVASRIARLETRSKEHAIPTQLKLFSTKGSENFSKRPGAPFNDARPEDLSALTVCQGKLLCRFAARVALERDLSTYGLLSPIGSSLVTSFG